MIRIKLTNILYYQLWNCITIMFDFVIIIMYIININEYYVIYSLPKGPFTNNTSKPLDVLRSMNSFRTQLVIVSYVYI